MNQWISQALDIVFPRRCFGCKSQEGPFKLPNLCFFCWDKSFQPRRYIHQKYPELRIYRSGIYRSLLKKIIIQSKFRRSIIGMDLLATYGFETLETLNISFDVISAVPSYLHRSAWRGVDLPGMLGLELSKKTKIEFCPNLIKKKKWVPRQKKLPQRLRAQNTRNLFQASEVAAGKQILIVDDIMTTGSTVVACYKAVKKQRPTSVSCLVMAKT